MLQLIESLEQDKQKRTHDALARTAEQKEKEKRKQETLAAEEMERQKYLIDDATFSSECKKSTSEKIAKYLEYNKDKDLLNCLGGLPLQQASRFGNIEVV